MRIACPGCAAEYDVPASRLTPRKVVRCARCGDQWVPVRETQEAPPASAIADAVPPPTGASIAPVPTVTAMDRLAAQAARPTRPRVLIAAWALTLTILAAGVVGVVTRREAIVRAWPAASRILGSPDRITPPTGAAVSERADQPRPTPQAYR